MPAADSIARAGIDAATKAKACAVLEKMGLNLSDAIRLLMLQIAEERRLPFEVRVPNPTTRQSREDIKRGKGKTFTSKKALYDDLGL